MGGQLGILCEHSTPPHPCQALSHFRESVRKKQEFQLREAFPSERQGKVKGQMESCPERLGDAPKAPHGGQHEGNLSGAWKGLMSSPFKLQSKQVQQQFGIQGLGRAGQGQQTKLDQHR